MGAGSGGFYAAKEAFRQAQQVGRGRAPRDFSASLMGLAGFSAMVAIWNTTSFVLAAVGVLIFLYGTVQGMVVTLLPKLRVRLRLAVGAAYALSVSAVYLSTISIASWWWPDGSYAADQYGHPLAACLSLAVGYVAFTITQKGLWKRYAAESFY